MRLPTLPHPQLPAPPGYNTTLSQLPGYTAPPAPGLTAPPPADPGQGRVYAAHGLTLRLSRLGSPRSRVLRSVSASGQATVDSGGPPWSGCTGQPTGVGAGLGIPVWAAEWLRGRLPRCS